MSISCLATVCLVAAQAVAQQRPADDTIVVTGQRSSPEQERREAYEFVRSLRVAAGERPAARWIDPICPKVTGVAPATAALVEAKVRLIASQSGAPVASKRCEPNVVIGFATSGVDFMREIVRRSPRRLTEVPVQDRESLIEGGSPIPWWYTTGLQSRDGARPAGLPTDNTAGGASAIPSNGRSISFSHYNSSIISTQVVRALRSASVVVDVTRAEGLSLGAISFYAALIALAEIRFEPEQPKGSILALFKSERDRRSLTERDTTFLASLYRLPLDRTARAHRGLLVRGLLTARDKPQR